MTTLSYVNVFVRDLEATPDFYKAVFGLPEQMDYRTPAFRALSTPTCAIGFQRGQLRPDLRRGGRRSCHPTD